MYQTNSILIPVSYGRIMDGETIFQIERNGEVAIIRLLDSIEVYEAALIRAEILRSIEGSGIRGIVFSFADVPYIDSSGVGVFVNLHQRLRDRIPLRFCDMGAAVKDVMRYTRLVSLFAIDDTESESLTRMAETLNHE